MFTGIVQESALIVARDEGSSGARFELKPNRLSAMKLGDSVSVDGVCLTVCEVKADSIVVEATPETLRCTNLGDRQAGDSVNLEPSARPTDFLGGHWVQGHVDDTGEVESLETEGNSQVYRIRASEAVLRYCTLKGSIAVNGVSLTISGLNTEYFEVTIIPHTLEVTNFQELKPGDRVNLEADILSKYVESHVGQYVEAYLKRLGKLVLFLGLGLSCLLASDFSPGPNTILVYENQNRTQANRFVLRMARYHPDIVMEWESDSSQGTLHLYRSAVEEGNGFTLMRLFEVGVDMESPEMMTVWLSKKAFRELTGLGQTKLKINRFPATMEMKGEGTYRFLLNKETKEIPVIYVEDSRSGSWTFHNDPDNPILVECKLLYFSQSLKSVSTANTNKLRWIREVPAVK